MEVLITGANGQLGRALRALLPQAIFTDVAELDITDAKKVADFDASRFDVVINAAAYTSVDGAETDEGRVLAQKINVDGVRNLVGLAERVGAIFVNISTDYVFDGLSLAPYREDDLQNPLSVYGATKASGEAETKRYAKHYLVRTSWVYGEGKNFVRTMLELAKTREEVSVVNDQTGRPTFAADLAWAVIELIRRQAPFGTYNVTNSGEPISWADFAREIFALQNLTCLVRPVSTEQFTDGKTGLAKRPSYSVLDIAKLEHVGIHMPHWKHALKSYLSTQ